MKSNTKKRYRLFCYCGTILSCTSAAVLYGSGSGALAHAGDVIVRARNFWSGERRTVTLDKDFLSIMGIMVPQKAGQPGLPGADLSGLDTAITAQETTTLDYSCADVTVLASGLISPDGIALHPKTWEVYFSEEDAARISYIHGRQTVEAITEETPIFGQRSKAERPQRPLRFPEAICFDKKGMLYAAEDIPGGRVVRFEPTADGRRTEGHEIEIPGNWSRFAWEGMEIGPEGEVVLAGSNLEYASASAGNMVPILGVILHRDIEGGWWIVHQAMLSSFSSVALSKDGTLAVYVCELSGTVGWIDLTDSKQNPGQSRVTARSPECVSILSNGHLLVTEEAGTLLVVDPEFGGHCRLAQQFSSLETAIWDELQGRVVLSEDGTGRLLSLTFKPFKTFGANALTGARFEAAHTPRHIPDQCPDYLARILSRGGVEFREPGAFPMTFPQFAHQVPMVAMSARAVPVNPGAPHPDPVTDLSFAVFQPAEPGLDDERLRQPIGIMHATRASGERIVTTIRRVRASKDDVLLDEPVAAAAGDLLIPYAGALSVDAQGIADIHWIGMGETPDMHVRLNPADPDGSSVTVTYLNGQSHEYSLEPGAGSALRDNMVISYTVDLQAEKWTFLGRDQELVAKKSGVNAGGDLALAEE